MAVYSILYDAVLHPWPYAGIERICDVWLTGSRRAESPWGLTGPQIRQLRETHAVEDVVVTNYTTQTVTGGEVPDDVVVEEMSGSYLQFLGMGPPGAVYGAGRCCLDGQDPQPVAVSGYRFWQRHYRGDPGVVETDPAPTIRTIRLWA